MPSSLTRNLALLTSSGGSQASATMTFGASATIAARRPLTASAGLYLASGGVQLRGRFILAASASLVAGGSTVLAGRLWLAGAAAAAFLTPDSGPPLRMPGRVLAAVLPSLAVRSRVGDE